MAHDLAALCTSVPGEPHVEILPGAPFAVSVIEEGASKVNHLLAAHVEQSEFVAPNLPPLLGDTDAASYKRKSMKLALDNLASLARSDAQAELRQRNPESVLSFSLRRPEVVEMIRER